ncbi:hypothetical protein ACIQF6_22960 [Kitasatospora sp. NPDC092948]|uniref:hypothetical protein n=1 Tax=Kitasatospora sp. NPDC092948 TaxID=3364088 RepID=UPI0037FD0092
MPVAAKPSGRLPFILLGAVVAAWMTYVVVAISTTTPPGASSENELSAEVMRAVKAGDSKALQEYFSKETTGDHYAEAWLASLGSVPPESVEVRETDRALIVSTDPNAEAGCTVWGLTKKEGRWLLVTVPPLPTPPCRLG